MGFDLYPMNVIPHPVPEARKVGAPSISKYFAPIRLLDDRSYVGKIRKTRNQSVSPYLVT